MEELFLTCFATKEYTDGQYLHRTMGEQQQNKNKTTIKQEQLSSPQSHVLMTYDFGNCENCELNTEII